MIAAPPLLIGASLLFWGWQTGNWLAAIAIAIPLELLRRAGPRFDLGATEHARIADLCTVLFEMNGVKVPVQVGHMIR